MEEFAPRQSKRQAARRRSPRSIRGRDPSLRWPHLYDILRAKGYSKEKAARISNSRLRYRKKGRLEGLPWQQADNPKMLAKLRNRRRSRTASALVAACHSKACAPPPAGKGGSTKGGKRKVRAGGRVAQALKAARNPEPKTFADYDRGGRKAVYKKPGGFSLDSVVFACYDKSCAPPPVGKGGSSKGGSKGSGVLPDTTENRRAYAQGWAAGERGAHGALERADDRGVSQAWKVGFYDQVGGEHKFAGLGAPAPKAQAAPKAAKGDFKVISSSEARGDSKPVSYDEFQALAREGQAKLDAMKANTGSTQALASDNGRLLKKESWKEVQTEWGGATIDARTGKALPQGVDKYAMTIKEPGMETVSIPIEGMSRTAFNRAYDSAIRKFQPILRREGSHLGIFRDDDVGRIDFDPVIVVDNLRDVHTIGAATRAIGGAYNFKDGNGYWPPHVKD